jgi:hypothetical protein
MRRAVVLVQNSVPTASNSDRVSGVLASNHVKRKESQCTFLQFYKENDLLI